MKITGQTTLDASAKDIWPLIFDPTTLLQLLPGCEQVEQVAPDEYRGRMNLRIPAIAGTYDTWVKVLQYEAPKTCLMKGEARGPAGSVNGQASFSLEPEGDQTRIAYQGDAQIAGPLAGMNPRFAEGVAQTLIKQGLAKLPELARERAAAAEPVKAAGFPEVPTPFLRGFSAWVAALLASIRRFFGRISHRPSGGQA
jgi:uncharacterized protein